VVFTNLDVQIRAFRRLPETCPGARDMEKRKKLKKRVEEMGKLGYA
jgi:hypothetical protein